MEAQALEHAAKLKEAVNEATAATTTKTEMETQAGKLKEERVISGKNIEALKGEVQKVTDDLGEL